MGRGELFNDFWTLYAETFDQTAKRIYELEKLGLKNSKCKVKKVLNFPYICKEGVQSL